MLISGLAKGLAKPLFILANAVNAAEGIIQRCINSSTTAGFYGIHQQIRANVIRWLKTLAKPEVKLSVAYQKSKIYRAMATQFLTFSWPSGDVWLGQESADQTLNENNAKTPIGASELSQNANASPVRLLHMILNTKPPKKYGLCI